MSEIDTKIEVLKLVLQAIIGVGLVSYCLGFLIVNSYLFQFGFTSYGLFKTRYVAAGLNMIFLSLISTTLTLSFTGVKRESNLKHLSESASLVRLAVYAIGTIYSNLIFSFNRPGLIEPYLKNHFSDRVLGSLIGLFIFLVLLVPGGVMHLLTKAKRWDQPTVEKGKHIVKLINELGLGSIMLLWLSSVSLYLVLWIGGLAFIGFLILRFVYPKLKSAGTNSGTLTRKDWIFAILAIPIFFSFIYAFSIALYPNIRQSVGGGKPLRVQLFLRPERVGFIANVLKVNDDGLSAEVELMDQTDQQYFLLTKPEKENDKRVVMQLDKDNFDGIMYLSNQKK